MKTLLIVWAVGIIGCLIMKKIQPKIFKLYAVYVAIICVLFTVLKGIFLFAV